MSKQSSFLWTKDNIKKVLDLWSSKTTQEIATEIGCEKAAVQVMAAILRKEGAKIEKKTMHGVMRKLATEALAEMRATGRDI